MGIAAFGRGGSAHRLAAACLLGACCCTLAPSAAAQSSEAAEAATRVHERGGYPSTLPREGTFEDPEAPAWPDDQHRRDSTPELSPSVGSVGGEPAWGTFLVVVLVAGLVLAAVVFLFQLAGRPSDRAPRSTRAPAPPLDPATPAASGPLADDVSTLIAAGRLDEALALLFAKACAQLGHIAAARDDSNTARELLAAVAANDPRHAPFRSIVHRVEGVRFAGRTATDDDVRLVQQDLERLRAVGSGP